MDVGENYAKRAGEKKNDTRERKETTWSLEGSGLSSGQKEVGMGLASSLQEGRSGYADTNPTSRRDHKSRRRAEESTRTGKGVEVFQFHSDQTSDQAT